VNIAAAFVTTKVAALATRGGRGRRLVAFYSDVVAQMQRKGRAAARPSTICASCSALCGFRPGGREF
jgi:hypothetical protein